MREAQKEDSMYNVCCLQCGDVFQPAEGSYLWRRAEKRDEEGYLDALHVSGEECGCVEPVVEAAPFRVFGYDGMCVDFSMSYDKFTEAVRAFVECLRGGDVVFIEGVSDKTRSALEAAY